MFEAIKRLLKAVWNFIKKIVLKLVSFVRNIVSFFRDPSRLRKLQEDKNKRLFVHDCGYSFAA